MQKWSHYEENNANNLVEGQTDFPLLRAGGTLAPRRRRAGALAFHYNFISAIFVFRANSSTLTNAVDLAFTYNLQVNVVILSNLSNQ